MPTLFNIEVMGAYSKLGKRGNFTFWKLINKQIGFLFIEFFRYPVSSQLVSINHRGFLLSRN